MHPLASKQRLDDVDCPTVVHKFGEKLSTLQALGTLEFIQCEMVSVNSLWFSGID